MKSSKNNTKVDHNYYLFYLTKIAHSLQKQIEVLSELHQCLQLAHNEVTPQCKKKKSVMDRPEKQGSLLQFAKLDDQRMVKLLQKVDARMNALERIDNPRDPPNKAKKM
jgi:hypothetical protein